MAYLATLVILVLLGSVVLIKFIAANREARRAEAEKQKLAKERKLREEELLEQVAGVRKRRQERIAGAIREDPERAAKAVRAMMKNKGGGDG